MNALPERPFRHFVPNALRGEPQTLSQIFDLEVLFGGHYCFYKVAISGDQGSMCCCGLSDLNAHANYRRKLQCDIH